MTEEEKAVEEKKGTAPKESTPNRNAAAIRSYLDTEDGQKQKKSRKSTLAGRQTVILAVVLAVLLVAVLLYITVISPMLKNKPTVDPTEKEKPTLIEGEVYTEYGGIGMFETIRAANMKELSIQNESGEWGYEYDAKDDAFYLKGYKKTYTICDTSTWTTLMYQFGNAAAVSRVEAGGAIDYATYGLGEGDPTRSCTVRTRDGHTRTITVGAETASGSGSYAYVTFDGVKRDAVYIVGSTMANCVQMNLVDLMNPIVTIPFDNEDYIPERFTIYHEGNPFVDVRLLTNQETSQSESAKTTHVRTANGIEYNSSVQYATFLYDVIRVGIQGKRVVAISGDDQALSADDLRKWGIRMPEKNEDGERSGEGDQPFVDVGIFKNDVWQYLLFSEKTEENTYYVFVAFFDMIVEVDATAVEFIEWEEKEFIEASVYLLSIYNMKELTVDSTAMPDSYVASGVPRVKEHFSLTSKMTTAADGSNTYVLTDVKYGEKGLPIPDPVGSKLNGIANFKHYFMVLMTVSVQLDVPEDVLEQINLDQPDVTITVHTVRDQEHILRFYFYNSRHAYYTLDGKGQFYVVYDEITKFLKDTVLVTAGKEVQWETKNNESVDVNEKGNGEVVVPSEPDEPADNGALPTSVVVIIVIVAVLLVGGVGGFAVYAAIRKKREREGNG